MSKLFNAILMIVMMASCGNSFNIKGTSDITDIDGQKLYLKIINNNEAKAIDSCEIVHGEFSFKGSTDSTRLAGIFMGEQNVLMFILEEGEINIKIDAQGNNVSGTALNDTLYNFFKDMSRITNKFSELDTKQSEAIMDGRDIDEVNKELAEHGIQLENEKDSILTDFIERNYDNILGSSVFMLVTSSTYQYPMLDPWIEEIMTKATKKFKNDPYVKEFYEKALENQEIMNGMKNPENNKPQAEHKD